MGGAGAGERAFDALDENALFVGAPGGFASQDVFVGRGLSDEDVVVAVYLVHARALDVLAVVVDFLGLDFCGAVFVELGDVDVIVAVGDVDGVVVVDEKAVVVVAFVEGGGGLPIPVCYLAVVGFGSAVAGGV